MRSCPANSLILPQSHDPPLLPQRRDPQLLPQSHDPPLLPQRRDPALEAVEGEWKHPRPEYLQHDLRRARVAPRALRLGVEPDRVPIGVDQALEPRGAGLVVHVLDAAARLHDFVGTHGRVADQDQPPVRSVLVQKIEGRDALVTTAAVVAPDVIVDAVVEVEVLEMAELALRRREQLFAHLDVRFHRAADVEEEQHLDAIAALRHQVQIEPAGVFRGAVDGRGEVELLGYALARETAQPPQRNLDVARVELDRVVEIAKRPLVPDLDRAAIAAFFLADADTFRVVAVRAEGAGTRGADPLRAALVTAAVLLEPGFKRLHQLVPAAECLDESLVFLRKIAFDQFADPFLGNLRTDVEHAVDTFEIGAERQIEAVIQRLVLDHAGAG